MDLPAGLPSLSTVIFLTGLLHFCQVPAMLIAPRMLGWRDDLAKVTPINRRIIAVMGLGIVLTVLGLGVVVMVAAEEIAAGSLLGAALAAFLGIFWTYRGAVQVVLYSQVWPAHGPGRLSHYGLAVLFAVLALVYWGVFVRGLLR